MSTKVVFVVLDYEKNLLINRIHLKVANITIDITNDSPQALIKNFPKSVDDFYVEKIELFTNEKLARYFRFRIYKNQVNCHSILLNKLNNFSFEIGFFDKNNKKIPDNLPVKIEDKNYDLKPICVTDLPFINSFGIINCDKAILINEKKEIFLEEEKKGSFHVNFIATLDNHIINIIKIHKKYYPKLIKHLQLNKDLKSIVGRVKNFLNDNKITKSDFSIFLSQNIPFWNKSIYLEDYNHYIKNKLYPLDNDDYTLLLNYTIYLIINKVNKHTESYPILKCFFDLLELLEQKMKNKLINQRDILSFAYFFYLHYCSIEKYKNCLEEKMDSYKDLYDNSKKNWLDFDILFINECNKESAYNKAKKLLEDVLLNLKQNSKLLEILYLLDSGSGNVKKKKYNPSSKTSFNLSMISKENIISHIKILVPNIIIRKSVASNKNSEPYAECDINSGIMTFYEQTLFKKNLSETKKFLIDKPDINDNYSITIFICLLHEICSHLKLTLKDKKIKSPNVINDPYDIYNELQLEKKESGRTMEYYLSQDIKKIKFLKFSFSPKKDLYNPNIWTDENFEKLNQIIGNLMDNNDTEEYLDYKIAFFPKKENKKNEEIENVEIENTNIEIDWEFSSPEISEDEKNFNNKPDMKNIYFHQNDKLENSFEYEDEKPIIKY